MANPFILILGDSLTLPRPVEGIHPEDTWPFQLQKKLEEQGAQRHIYHRGSGGANIKYTLQTYIETVEPYLPQIKNSIAILQCGIVDCAPRPIPSSVKRLIQKLPFFLSKQINVFLKNNRASVLRLGINFKDTSFKSFESLAKELLERLIKKFDHVQVIGVAPADFGFEVVSPGISSAIKRTNDIYKQLIHEHEGKMSFIDLETEFGSSPEKDQYISAIDHHHFLSKGHGRVAELLAQNIVRV